MPRPSDGAFSCALESGHEAKRDYHRGKHADARGDSGCRTSDSDLRCSPGQAIRCRVTCRRRAHLLPRGNVEWGRCAVGWRHESSAVAVDWMGVVGCNGSFEFVCDRLRTRSHCRRICGSVWLHAPDSRLARLGDVGSFPPALKLFPIPHGRLPVPDISHQTR